MAGHSQFKNIMHRKGRQDKIRAQIFAKLAREITVAAKAGVPDPAANARLRLAVQNARAENMPKDNIERAIAKASGADTAHYDEVRYEGFGPGKVAVIVEALTDNRARTASNVRTLFAKNGGAMGESGSVAFNFEKIGYVAFPPNVASADAMFESALNAGAEDVQTTETAHEIACKPEDLAAVRDALESVFGTPNAARMDWKPVVAAEIKDADTARALMALIDALNEDDDVQRVITNADIPDDIAAGLLD